MSKKDARILIVDDEKQICDILYRRVLSGGYQPLVAHDGSTALEMIKLGIPDLVLLDVAMPGMSGMDVLEKAKKMDPDLPILMITAWSGIDGAVQAIKLGAYDYLSKPIKKDDLLRKIAEALDLTGKKLRPSRTNLTKNRKNVLNQLRELMGPSDVVSRIVDEVAMVAPSDFAVIIQGDTGTGKELVARAIHNSSHRSAHPMVPVDCGAIPEPLFESELFGHEKGAFTGAISAKQGKFEMAEGGTLFLDEISNMPLGSQIKMLRAIQEKSFFRVGGTKPVKVDVRFIVATNDNLNISVKKSKFSRDLFYRLGEFSIHIPPLSTRREDIIYIAEKIIATTNEELGKTVIGISDSAKTLLLNHLWPGNVRQLRSVIRRAVLAADDRILPQHIIFQEEVPGNDSSPIETNGDHPDGLSLREIVRRNTMYLERKIIIETLKKTAGNKAKAARILQIDYTTIHAKIKQYGISSDLAYLNDGDE